MPALILALVCLVTAPLASPGTSLETGRDERADTASAGGPVFWPICFQPTPLRTDTLPWWAIGVEGTLRTFPLTTFHVGPGLGSEARGLLAPSPPGIIWHGVPALWVRELHGDVSVLSSPSSSLLSLSWGAGCPGASPGALALAPWEDVVSRPVSSVHVVRGDHNERGYAAGLSTGVSSSVFVVGCVGGAAADGDRTNSDYSKAHYDLRLDLRTRLVPACRIQLSREGVERGSPGPDPREWVAADTPDNPWFWASRFGTLDAMWPSDREDISHALAAVHAQGVVRSPVGLAVVRERLRVRHRRSVPWLTPQPHVRRAEGDLSFVHRMVSLSMPAAFGATQGTMGVAVADLERELEVVWTDGDSTWRSALHHGDRRGYLWGGFQGSVLAGYVVCTSSRGTEVSWGLSGKGRALHLDLEVGGLGWRDERVLGDMWDECLAGEGIPPSKGRFTTAWARGSRATPVGTLEVGTVAGWARDVAGWAEVDSLPPGVRRPWGPSPATMRGLWFRWQLPLEKGLTLEAWAGVLPWESRGALIPMWPRVRGSGKVTFTRPLGHRVVPTLALVATSQGERFAGAGETLPLPALWQLDLEARLAVGDFVAHLSIRNLTDSRQPEVRGFPRPGVGLRGGFSWLFWD